MRELVDVDFPEAERIRVVLDNLSTHTPAALYAAFPPAEARRVLRRLEFHYTPKHGSWLNMVEIEMACSKANVSIAASKAVTDLQHLRPRYGRQVIDIVGSRGGFRENVVPRRL